MTDWKTNALAASSRTQTGAILRCALAANTEDVPRVTGKGTITSDGFIIASFIDSEGCPHMGAFLGHVEDLCRNVTHLANHLDLEAHEREQLYAAIRKWIAVDYSKKGLIL